MKVDENLKPVDKWEKRRDCMKAINALYIQAPESVVDDIKRTVMEALEEEYDRGIEDGKIIQDHGTVNWIT